MRTPLARGYKRERRTKSKGLEKISRVVGIEGETLGNTGGLRENLVRVVNEGQGRSNQAKLRA